MVEHNLAKVGVASSSLVSRSIFTLNEVKIVIFSNEDMCPIRLEA